MARTKLVIARALILYLACLPLLGATAGAQIGDPPVETPRPIDPSPPPRPELPGAATVFVATSKPVTLRGFNGFSSDATPGQFRHAGHGHGGGVAAVDSPWGEQLRIRYWITPHGVTFEYDDDLKVRYRFDAEGTLQEIEAETPERVERMEVGKRAELAYLGQRDPAEFDMSAYRLIDEFLRARHSDAFITGLARFDAPAEVSCNTQGIQCISCILAWAVSVVTISNACLVGGVPTLGMACLGAILAHEALNFSCAATCIAWIEDCFGGAPPGTSIPDGCEP